MGVLDQHKRRKLLLIQKYILRELFDEPLKIFLGCSEKQKEYNYFYPKRKFNYDD